MLSASYARLGSELSGLKLQAIISGQIDANNCLEWGEKISKADYFDEIKSVYPIHDRLIKEPNFMLSKLYYNSLKSLIISFSATLEFFLKDSMQLNMMRNYSLLKKGLIESKQVIDPKDIVDIDDIELVATVYKGNIIKNLIMDCQSYTKYRPNETTGGIFVSWRRKEELPTGA